MSGEKVCAVVVTYNRKNLLLRCLENLKIQTRPLDGILLVDNNSTDGTDLLLMEKGYINKIPPLDLDSPWELEWAIKHVSYNRQIRFFYIKMNKNGGGAGGFHEGLKRAYEKGFDWFWMMDDDGIPKKDALQQLLSKIDLNAVYNAVVIPREDSIALSFGLLRVGKKPIYNYEELCKIAVNDICEGGNFFNGTLIPRKIIEKVGFPLKEYFIHGDETEYFLRIHKMGYKIFTNIKSFHFHPKASSNFTLTKYYYKIRNETNNIRLYKKYPNIRIMKYMIRSIINGIRYHGIKSIVPIFYGFKDAIFHNFINREFN